MNGLRIKVIEGTDGLRGLEDEWGALAVRAPNSHISLTPEWHRVWWECVGSNRGASLHLITARAVDGRLALVWPVVVERHGGVTVGAALGTYFSIYCDALLAPGLPAADADACLASAWDVVSHELSLDFAHFVAVRADARINGLLGRHAGAPLATAAATFLRCRDWPGWDAYVATLPKDFRKRQRQLRRRLEDRGTLSFEIVHDRERIGPLVALFLEQKRQWLSARGIVNRHFERPEMRLFLERVAAEMLALGRLNLGILSLDDRPIGIEFGLLFDDTLYSYQSSFTWDLRQLGVGRIATEEALRQAFAAGVTTVDFLAPAHDYKYVWMRDEMPVYEYACPFTVTGRAYRHWLAGPLRRRVKSLYDHLPSPARRLGGRLLPP